MKQWKLCFQKSFKTLWQFRRKRVLSACLFIVNSAIAQDLNYSYYSDSDDLYYQNVLVSYESFRSDLSWPYADELTDGNGFGVSIQHKYGRHLDQKYQRVDFVASYFRKYSASSSYYVHVGVEYLNHLSQSQWVPSLALQNQGLLQEGTVFWKSELRWGLSNLMASSSQMDQKSLDWKPQLMWRLDESLRLINRNILSRLSEISTKFQSSVDLMYGIRTTTPWVWVGFGAEYLKHSNTSFYYWSPESFWAVGPRFDAAFPLTDEIQFSMALNANRQKETNQPWGWGWSLSPGLQYGSRDLLNIKIHASFIQSLQQNSSWNSKEVTATIHWPF